MNTNSTKKWVVAALFAALTCICTMIIKIPTPTGGYIHPGDGMVLLCGIILGPGMGALAAGIGSMLSDLFGGYMAWVPATLIIKALSAATAGVLFRKSSRFLAGNRAAVTAPADARPACCPAAADAAAALSSKQLSPVV